MSNYSYDQDNIFAKMLRGEASYHSVYEDETTLAFMDIMPRSDGHTLVIPKTPARNIFDIAPNVLADLIVKTQRIAVAARIAMKADGLSIHQFSEGPGGQLVFHIHFHVIPHFTGVPLRPQIDAADPEILAKHAAMIRAGLG
jgi:histidine triad (HIT) family protein